VRRRTCLHGPRLPEPSRHTRDRASPIRFRPWSPTDRVRRARYRAVREHQDMSPLRAKRSPSKGPWILLIAVIHHRHASLG
jgi:hypothetical protein